MQSASALVSELEDRFEETSPLKRRLNFPSNCRYDFHDAFSASADQVFCQLCLLHVSNVNKEELMSGLKRLGFVLALKAYIFTPKQWHCEWRIHTTDEALNWLLEHISTQSQLFYCHIIYSRCPSPVKSDLRTCPKRDEERKNRWDNLPRPSKQHFKPSILKRSQIKPLYY